MKPIKNRFYCEDCGRVKMLFKTSKEANTFIKFNSDKILENNGYKPVRNYFCVYCGGWHITSRKGDLYIKSRTEEELNLCKQEENRTDTRKKNVLIREKKVNEFQESLGVLEYYILILKNSKEDTELFIKTLNKALEELEKIKSIRVVFNGSSKRKKIIEEDLNELKNKII